MTHSLLSFAWQDLDMAARRDRVASSLDAAWSSSVPRQSLLLRYREHVIVTDRKSIGTLTEPAQRWSPLEFALTNLQSSAVGYPVLVDTNGTAYMWTPPEPPKPVWHAAEAGAYAVASLGSNRLLILRFASGTMQEAYAVDTSQDRELWRLAAGFHLAAVVPQGILIWTAAMDALACVDIDTGKTKWRTPWQAGIDLIGMVDNILWAPGHSELHRIDCSNGQMLPPVSVENAHSPGGTLDDRGIFHCCNGLNYQTFDLCDGGRRLTCAEFRITAAGPTLGAGRGGTIATADGRLIFQDQRGGIWVVHAHQPGEPELAWRAKARISGLAVWRGQLLVAEDVGTLTALGVPLDEAPASGTQL